MIKSCFYTYTHTSRYHTVEKDSCLTRIVLVHRHSSRVYKPRHDISLKLFFLNMLDLVPIVNQLCWKVLSLNEWMSISKRVNICTRPFSFLGILSHDNGNESHHPPPFLSLPLHVPLPSSFLPFLPSLSTSLCLKLTLFKLKWILYILHYFGHDI